VDRFFWEKRNKNISNGNLKKKKKKIIFKQIFHLSACVKSPEQRVIKKAPPPQTKNKNLC
jgi:hypothetical protein